MATPKGQKLASGKNLYNNSVVLQIAFDWEMPFIKDHDNSIVTVSREKHG